MSKIQWTDATWNPITGCTRVSAGCDNCYAFGMTRRLAGMGQEKYKGLCGKGHFNGVVKCHDDALHVPLKRKKPTMYFVNSMSDLFHKEVPFDFIDKVFAVMESCRQHTFQVLTKRPERMAEYLTEHHPIWDTASKNWPLPNVWLGTSCENQVTADERIPHLLKCPAAVRFLSCEPLLAKINLVSFVCAMNSENVLQGHWVIVGGESGPKARHCRIDWIRGITQQCGDAGVPCFVKQLGARPVMTRAEWNEIPITNSWTGFADNPHGLGVATIMDRKGGDINEWPEDLRVRQFPSQPTVKVEVQA